MAYFDFHLPGVYSKFNFFPPLTLLAYESLLYGSLLLFNNRSLSSSFTLAGILLNDTRLDFVLPLSAVGVLKLDLIAYFLLGALMCLPSVCFGDYSLGRLRPPGYYQSGAKYCITYSTSYFVCSMVLLVGITLRDWVLSCGYSVLATTATLFPQSSRVIPFTYLRWS